MSQSAAVDYPSYSSARIHFKDVLDASEQGRSVTVARDGLVSVILSAERLRAFFFRSVSPRVELTEEDGRVIALMAGRAFASEGSSVDEALQDLRESLREYAEDWEARLQQAPNHRENWSLVQLVKLSSDDELIDWFEHGGE